MKKNRIVVKIALIVCALMLALGAVGCSDGGSNGQGSVCSGANTALLNCLLNVADNGLNTSTYGK